MIAAREIHARAAWISRRILPGACMRVFMRAGRVQVLYSGVCNLHDLLLCTKCCSLFRFRRGVTWYFMITGIVLVIEVTRGVRVVQAHEISKGWRVHGDVGAYKY